MNADGSGQRLLERGAWEDIAWSPDGREIAFLRVGSGEKPGLFVVKADGSGQRRLTRNAQASGFAWAPDGQTIAFTRVRGGYRDVHVMNADGSGQRRLAQRGIKPRWSPDRQQIAFINADAARRTLAGIEQIRHDARPALMPMRFLARLAGKGGFILLHVAPPA